MKVKFVPQNIELEIKPNQTVMSLAHENGIKIKSVCNGMPSCAECRVRVIDGEYNVLPPSRKELNLIGTGHFIDQRRLSCQLFCFGDITVDLAEQIEKENAVKRPQGTIRKDSAEQSHAVVGNLIEQEIDLVQAVNPDREELRKARQADTLNSEIAGEALVTTDGARADQRRERPNRGENRRRGRRSRRK